jgi:hypothetical protein
MTMTDYDRAQLQHDRQDGPTPSRPTRWERQLAKLEPPQEQEYDDEEQDPERWDGMS